MKYGRILKEYWLRFAKFLGKVNTIILLSLVYIIVIGVFALVIKVLRRDFLQKKIDKNSTTYWQERKMAEESLQRFASQF